MAIGKKVQAKIYLYPDHRLGVFVGDKGRSLKSFSYHQRVKQQLANASEDGLGYELFQSEKSIKDAKNAILVSYDRVLRERWKNQGFDVAPSIDLALLKRKGYKIVPVKITLNKEYLSYFPSLQSYHIEEGEKGTLEIVGLLSETELDRVIAGGFPCDILTFDPDIQDLTLVQIDEHTGLKEFVKQSKILQFDGQKCLVVLEGKDPLPSLHGSHGHMLSLFPDDKHLRNRKQAAALPLSELQQSIFEQSVLKLVPWWKYFLKPSTASSFEIWNNRYSGAADLDSEGPIVSRHILHPHNARAVQALFDDLQDLGYSPQFHEFQYQGRTYRNVVADLPGAGKYRIRKILQQKLKLNSSGAPFIDPEDFRKLINRQFEADPSPPPQAVKDLSQSLLEEILANHRPWWERLLDIRFGADLLLVGCHLDSTAGSTSAYNPMTDPAPGRDDNASGIAAVLEMAKYFKSFEGCFRDTIRFCFFNAEEQGLVGSKAYAHLLKSNNAAVKGAICLDMVGYNADAHDIFEVHAGYTDPAIRDLSLPLAEEIVAASLPYLGAGSAQLYQGISNGAGASRIDFDGAINRSDHAAFHEQGYAAVVVSEDFFINMEGEPLNDANPFYHRDTDLVIDPLYASKITCSVAKAVGKIVR